MRDGKGHDGVASRCDATAATTATDTRRAPSTVGSGQAGKGASQRLLRIGTCISSALITRTSSGTPQVKAGSTLILKWNMSCMAW